MDKALLEFAAQEQVRRKNQARNLVILLVAVLLGLGGIVYALREIARSQPAVDQVAIDPSQLPAIRPGPR